MTPIPQPARRVATAQGVSRADLLLTSVRVRSEATAELMPGPVAVRDGTIIAVGERAEECVADRQIDLDGCVVAPGFVDTHTHLGWAGASMWRANWGRIDRGSWPTASLAELARAAAEVEPGHWVLGGGWDRAKIPEELLPDRAALDELTGSKPCLLTSSDTRLALCNTAAARLMRLADLPSITGGEIELDDDGEPTGVLRGAAALAQPTAGIVPPTGRRRQLGELGSALRWQTSLGITETHDIATWPADPGRCTTYVERSFTDAGLYLDLATRGQLPVRVGLRPFLGRWSEFANADRETGHPLVTFTGLKLFVGGHGYYSDDGQRILDIPSFRYPGVEVSTAWVRSAHRHGIACSIHAVGDADVQVALDIFEAAFDGGDANRIPHRLVHLRSIRIEDIRRMRRLGIVAEVQPWDVVEDSPRLLNALGPNGSARLAPYRELVEARVPVVLGSDWRSADDLNAADPLCVMTAAVARCGGPDFARSIPGPGLTPEQALYAAGTAGARMDGTGPGRGAVEVGQAADLVVLSADPLSTAPLDWPGLERVLTVSAGRITYSARSVTG